MLKIVSASSVRVVDDKQSNIQVIWDVMLWHCVSGGVCSTKCDISVVVLCLYVDTGVSVMKFDTENSGAPLVLFLVPFVSFILTVLTV